MKKLVLLLLITFSTLIARGQDSSAVPKKLLINGYVKDLQTLSFDKDFNNSIAGILIHNRFNLKWKPTLHFTGVAEFRNRIFLGEEVKVNAPLILARNENEYLSLQKTWINNNSVLLMTNVERLYVDYHDPKFNLRIGRQRINWGMTNTWNPNDIFNVYNFLDFDFEERPGVDGGKLRYLLNNTQNIEFAYAHNRKQNGNIAAMKYAFNKWDYDIQVIAGWYDNRATVGAGFSGYIKDAGFKGEGQYFFSHKDSTDHLNLSLEEDYKFDNGWYLNVGGLYNSQGLTRPVNHWASINLNLSPDHLMPTKYNLMVTTIKELNPLLSANVSVLYSPGTNLFILFPSVQYNLATNFDVDLVWQSFFAELNSRFQAINHRCYLRIKWSF